MIGKKTIISLAMLGGFIVWFIDTVMHYFLYYQDQGSFFWEVVILDHSGPTLYFRSFLMLGVLASSMLFAEIFTRGQQAEIALKESEKKYRRLFESASDAIFILGLEEGKTGQIIAANQEAAEMHGYNIDELLTMNIYELDSHEAVSEIPQRIQRMLSGERIREEVNHIKKDGTVFPVEINAGLLEIGGEKYILAFDRDITERKQAEEDARRSYQFTRLLNNLLEYSLKGCSTEELLSFSIDEITSLPWLEVEPKGAIFLVEERPEVLILKAARGFNEQLTSMCAQVPFGKCLCGRVAQTAEPIFSDCVDERHDHHYEGMQPHGHYCVPITSSGEGNLIGVLNLYIREGAFSSKKEEKPTMLAIANVLGSIIERKQAEEALKKSGAKLKEQKLALEQKNVDLREILEQIEME